jgi:hypothetical protein
VTTWVKSSLSFANGNCVEVSEFPGGDVGVRNSRDAAGAVLRFTPDEWRAFIGGVQDGEFDRFGVAGERARLLRAAEGLQSPPDVPDRDVIREAARTAGGPGGPGRKSPGQAVYEAQHAAMRRRFPGIAEIRWDELSEEAQAEWEGIAEAGLTAALARADAAAVLDDDLGDIADGARRE